MNEESDYEIDDDIKALIPNYLESRKKDVITLMSALQNKDLSIIAKLSHNMKGTAISYGQKELDTIAIELNTACKNEDWDQIKISLNKMDKYLGT